ncbi:MAG: hypothetical protein JWO74_4161 [Solirubrobacterales bacterium]|jgi:D-aspartate ligase|nr:hypothetical protein [Solirubrobacterales bacterium]
MVSRSNAPGSGHEPSAALLLGGGTIAVPVARSLGRAGVPVYVLGATQDPVRHSRHCRRFVDVGSGEGVQERWLAWLGSGELPRGIVMPCNDDALELMARHRATLESLGHRAIEANDEVVLAMLDKHRTYALAREVGVPAPRTVLVGPHGAGVQAGAEVGFPCAVKPRHAHHLQRHFGLRRKLLVAEDPVQLARHLATMRELGVEALVTEIIPGADDDHHSYYTYMDAAGRPLLHLTKRKLRQYPNGFGLATYHVVHRNEEVRELGLRFFEAIGVRGVANVEFKRDARDGRLKLIECNHRFTAGHEIVRHAGIDLALLAYNRVAGRPDPPVGAYRAGVRMWHPVEDARAFAEYRRAGKLTSRAWMRSLLHRQHFPLFAWSDPMPSLRSVARFARVPFRGLRRTGGYDDAATAAATAEPAAAVPQGGRGSPAARRS